jgi:hypothetical protein
MWSLLNSPFIGKDKQIVRNGPEERDRAQKHASIDQERAKK